MTNNILMRIDFQNDFVHPHGALTLNNPELIIKHQHLEVMLQLLKEQLEQILLHTLMVK